MALPAEFPALNDVVRFAAIAPGPGSRVARPAQWYRVSSVGVGPDSWQTQAINWATAVAAFMGPCQESSTSIIGATAKKLYPLPQSLTFTGGIVPVSGSFGPDLLPPQTSGLVSKYSTVPGRANRGRWYQPWPADSAQGPDGQPVAGYVTVLGFLAGFLQNPVAFGAGATAITFQPVIGSYKASRPIPLHMVDQVACTGQPWFATQRRRGHFRVAHR